jgi:serine/threonine protein kinase
MMDYRRTSLVLNQKHQQQTSTNSHIYASFAGASPNRNTNGILPETPTMWWDEERIEATVTRQFVSSKLRPDEQVRLDEPLGFGDGLTDDTYMEWIELKAKRIFLILNDLGVPDQIFGVIDDSWDDDDLPVPLDQVERLQLTYNKDEKLERKFFHRQFVYLLRNIQKGEQVTYDDEEVVPLELAEKRPVGAVTGLTHSNIDKVHLPGRPDDVFIRRRIPLGLMSGRMPLEEFLSGVEAMKAIEHDHLISLWASYIHQDCGYLLLTPVNDTTLKSFLTVTPQSIKILAKQERRIHLLNWIHCLADALSFLHSQGLAHRNIKPSTVMLDIDNHIFLSDSGFFSSAPLTGDKMGFDKETYDYSAPEMAQRPTTPAPSIRPLSRPGTSRQAGVGLKHSSIYSTTASVSTSSNSNDSASVYTTSTGSHPSASSSPPQTLPLSSPFLKHDPQKADIFSLGTIFLEILTFLLKRASRNFASHRSAKNKTPGRGGGLPDSSFHKNLGQVESWVNTLTKDASKKEDKIFRGVSHILNLAEKMINVHPEERPSAGHVQERMYTILSDFCGLGQGNRSSSDGSKAGRIHCETRNKDQNEWDFGFDELRLASQRAAAEACASVNPTTSEVKPLGWNGGVIYGVERNSVSVSVGGYSGGSGGKDGDRMSIATKTSRSSEGKSASKAGSGGGGGPSGQGKVKPKAKAWQAPVYAGQLGPFLPCMFTAFYDCSPFTTAPVRFPTLRFSCPIPDSSPLSSYREKNLLTSSPEMSFG